MKAHFLKTGKMPLPIEKVFKKISKKT